MGTRDKRIDAYIAKAQPFAQPILKFIRETVHDGCPDVEETMKWSMPFFMYKGMLCNMASFNEHCAFGFWKGSLILDEKQKSEDAMGQFGRISSLKDLPPKKVLLGYVKRACELNESGIKKASPPRTKERKELIVPEYFLGAVKKNKKAFATFESFPYSKRKDYVEWVTEAKTDDTRNKRLRTTVEWLSEGKSRNWKYEKC